MILFTGRGSSGSWQIRGVQLGKACKGIVKPQATLEDCKRADLIVLVKRPTQQLMANIKASKTPWVWDVVDFYPQPLSSTWSKSKAKNWVKTQIARHNPNAVIWPNVRMGDDCRTATKGFTLYHHHWPNIRLNAIRSEIKTVGYEGSPRYLGEWGEAILLECQNRGWDFVVNQGVHADFDLCLAFRADEYNGYVPYHWKSNVKLANCHGSGTPFIGPAESGYVETSADGELWVEDIRNISGAFDYMTHERRLDIHQSFLKNAYSLDAAAADLLGFLKTV